MDDKTTSNTNLAIGLSQFALQLSQCDRQIRLQLRQAISSLSLEEQQYLLLSVCQQLKDQPPSQKELAFQLSVSPPQVSLLVEQLRQQDLIHGIRDPKDRRRQVWVLTNQGELLLNQGNQKFQNVLSDLTSCDSLPISSSIDALQQSFHQLTELLATLPTSHQKAA